MPQELTPREIVAALDRYIIGQSEAKKAVAIALRNRYRRRLLTKDMQDEVLPKNILMIGPTGVGKTEIARRLARLVNAPFIKVEATKYTEVGYVGRDVESMIRDLVEVAVRMVRQEKQLQVDDQARFLVEERLLEILAPLPGKRRGMANPLEALFGGRDNDNSAESPPEGDVSSSIREKRAIIRQKLRRNELEDDFLEVETQENANPFAAAFTVPGMEEFSNNLQDAFSNVFPKRKKTRRVKISEARKILLQEESDKLIDQEELVARATERVEQNGIVFVDEIDKIAGRGESRGPDVSREGVQRDILPLVEGSTVNTKYGPVKTDHILFIAAGAFHTSKPSDLIPELQGRFPIRVELCSLAQEDFCRILTEPYNSLLRQYTALLQTEGIEVNFSAEAIERLGEIAYMVNNQTEDIGARRLHTVMEKLLEDLFFQAPDVSEKSVLVDLNFVNEKLEKLVENRDLSRYIL